MESSEETSGFQNSLSAPQDVPQAQSSPRPQGAQQPLSQIIAQLNEQQREIVLAPSQDMMIIAGAGTGKTHVVTSRIAFLIDKRLADPWQILAVTFTEKAAQEMTNRVCSYLGWQDPHEMAISTFHSFCYRTLQHYATEAALPQEFVLLTPPLQRTLLKNFLHEQGIDCSSYVCPPSKGKNNKDWGLTLDGVINYIGRKKDEMCKPSLQEAETEFYLQHLKDEEELLKDPDRRWKLKEVLFACYESLRNRAGAVDYEDLINYMVTLLRQNQEIRTTIQQRFNYIFVDEFQDTNTSQYELLMLLKGPNNYVCVVGDDDQSIYGWRGAQIANFQRLREALPQLNLYELTINYRSSRQVLNFSNALIVCNRSRMINKFLVDASTYEGLQYCVNAALKQLFTDAREDPQKRQRLQGDEFLRPYLDKDGDKWLAELKVHERQEIFAYAKAHHLLDQSWIEREEKLHWGYVDAKLPWWRQALPESWADSYQEAHQDLPFVQLIEYELSGFLREGTCVCSLIQYLQQVEGVPLEQIAVLYRKSKLADEVRRALVKHHIPHQLRGETSFYGREEVITALAYLRLLLNPRDDLSFKRVVSMDLRAVNENALSEYATKYQCSLYEAVEQQATSIDPRVQQTFWNAMTFCQFMDKCRPILNNYGLGEFVKQFFQQLGLSARYQKLDHQQNTTSNANKSGSGSPRADSLEQLIRNIVQFEQECFSRGQGNGQNSTEALLRAFLDKAALSANGEGDQSGDPKTQGIRLMTIHASKGLEFTAVIVLGCQNCVFPSAMTKDMEEERRLAYVAFTRAKRYLFACYAQSRHSKLLKSVGVSGGSSAFLKDIKQSFALRNIRTKKNGLPYERRLFVQQFEPDAIDVIDSIDVVEGGDFS